jgi:hypothetical protein
MPWGPGCGVAEFYLRLWELSSNLSYIGAAGVGLSFDDYRQPAVGVGGHRLMPNSARLGRFGTAVASKPARQADCDRQARD